MLIYLGYPSDQIGEGQQVFNGLLAFDIQCLLELIRVKADQTNTLVTMFLIAR
jgi:hypothetical protein